MRVACHTPHQQSRVKRRRSNTVVEDTRYGIYDARRYATVDMAKNHCDVANADSKSAPATATSSHTTIHIASPAVHVSTGAEQSTAIDPVQLAMLLQTSAVQLAPPVAAAPLPAETINVEELLSLPKETLALLLANALQPLPVVAPVVAPPPVDPLQDILELLSQAKAAHA